MRVAEGYLFLLLAITACAADAPIPVGPVSHDVPAPSVIGAASTWTARDLGFDPEYGATVGWKISNRGQIAGYVATTNRPVRAFTQRPNGPRVLLRGLPNDSGTFAAAINSSGIAVGQSLAGYFSLGRPVWWDAAGNISPVPGAITGLAEDISDGGWIVGTASVQTSIQKGFRWRVGSTLELLGGSGFVPFSAAHAVNDDGLAVGDLAGPVLWDPAGSVLPIPLPPGALNGVAVDINNAGEVAGYLVLTDFTQQAFKWTRRQGTTALPQPPGMTNSIAFGIDKRGRVFGMAAPTGGFLEPFVWENGVPIALPKPGFIVALYGVNACGVAVGANIQYTHVSSVMWLTDC